MKDILKILFKFKWKMLLVIFLLLCQAYCSLALPQYTSDIVNVGIASSGIESIVPNVISKDVYNKLIILLEEPEKNILSRNYNCNVNDNKYKKDVCVLEDISDDDKLELESVVLYPLLTLTLYENSDISFDTELVEKVKSDYNENESFFQDKILNYLLVEYENVGVDLVEKQMSYIYSTGFKMIFVTLVGLVLTIFSMYLTSKIASDFGRDLRNKLVKKIMFFESEELSNFSTSSLLTRCTNDIFQVQNSVFILFRIIIFAPIMGIGASVKVNDSPMGWVIILSVVVILSIMLVLFLVVVPKFKKFQDLLDRLNLVSRESLTGLPVIRAYSNLEYEEKRFEKVNEDLTKNNLFIMKSMGIFSPTLTFLMNSVSILIVWIGASYINNGSMAVGDLIAFISYTMQIITAFLMVSMVLIMIPRMVVSFKRISEVFKTKSKVLEKNNPINVKSVKGDIEFKNVCFRYPGSNTDVLKNINIKIKSGSVTAFIGSTGSGKSTLVNLIPRFFDVTDGSILIDGKDIKDFSLESLRNVIGYVPQKGWLQTGTIMSNIMYGSLKKDKDLMIKSAKISESFDFINEKEKKFDSEISAGGTNVSGGQRQRLSIARAIAKKPDIFIFDDSFSALDFKTEANIRKNLNKELNDKTILIVSSRISSVMHAEKIIVLNEGVIVGVGTHEELSKSCKVYKEIKTSQLGGESDE